jgi:hypothetical protein
MNVPFLRFWRLLAILFMALSFGTVLGHLLELPAKLSYDGPLWLKISQTLYGNFGTFGAAFEMGAIVTTAILAVLVRHHEPTLRWTLLALLGVVIADIAFWVLLVPVNTIVAQTTVETLPADWMKLRQQWEYTHAARAVLQFSALAALVHSVLVKK